MSQKEILILKWSDKLLNHLLERRKENPNLKFWLRQRNTKNRLDKGHWFQGTEDYIFIGFYNRSGGANRTRSVGFVVGFNENEEPKPYIEIVFKGEEDSDVIKFYKDVIDKIGGFEKVDNEKYYRSYPQDGEVFKHLDEFLDTHKPIMDSVKEEQGLDEKLDIADEKFTSALKRIQNQRMVKQNSESKNINYLLVNISWNSKNWKELSEDKSNHAWVKEGGLPHESWNFDLDNPRNSDGFVKGYAKFTSPPKVEANNNLLIFYSDGKIVGFYGKSEVLKENIEINEEESYNLIAPKDLVCVLTNKIEDPKNKGYLENLKRVGQVGFSYLEKEETIANILDEAIKLNPEQSQKLIEIKNWSLSKRDAKKTIKKDKNWFKLARVVQKIENQNHLDKYFDLVNEILKYHGLKSEDKRTYAFAREKKNRIHLTVGGIYSVAIELKGQSNIISFYASIEDFERLEKLFPNAHKIEKRSREGREEDKGVWIEVLPDDLNIEDVKDTIIKAVATEMNVKASQFRTNYDEKHNPWIYEAAKDKNVREQLLNENFEEENRDIKSKDMGDLNQILFGPPGTGKTYQTIDEAVKIASPDFYKKHSNKRDKIREEFERLLIRDWEKDKTGRIAFCTFHQSFSYEDFVEGIKPFTTPEKQVYYDLDDGIFKRLCQRSKDEEKSKKLKEVNLVSLSKSEYQKAFFYKISLGDSTKSEDLEIYDYCIKNDFITVGYGDQEDFSNLNEKQIQDKIKELGYSQGHAQGLNYFIHYLQKENFILVSNGNRYVRALGKVVGDYEFIKESPIAYNHFRKVEWIFINEEIPVSDLYDRNFSQQTIYKLDKNGINQDFFVHQPSKTDVDELGNINNINTSDSNYVLIIDEINRGNISSIFGELITLIEKDKRKGGDEELELMLPYSKSIFSVPSNVHLIGTMNTADRSIEALDTALRRRFKFIEVPSEPQVIKEKSESKGQIGKIDLVKMLSAINARIEKLIDKDHCIGHAYFLKLKNLDELQEAFQNKVIPLLQEYFFGDFGKIGLVLGNDFVSLKNKTDDFEFATLDGYDSGLVSDLKQRPTYNISVPKEEEGFIKIYQNNAKED